MPATRARLSLFLFLSRRDPPSFPVRDWRLSARSLASITVIALMSAATAPDNRVRAESAPAVQSKKAQATQAYATLIGEAAQRFGVPANWISAVMVIESGGELRAVSAQGAMGLMQIMPDTWADLRVRHGLGPDPFEPRDNIQAGAAYLREMHDRYGFPGFLAAYNTGPGRYDDHLATGRALPPETQSYVAMLVPLIGEGQAASTETRPRRGVTWQESPLFAARAPASAADVVSSPPASTPSTSAGGSARGAAALAPLANGLFVRQAKARRLP